MTDAQTSRRRSRRLALALGANVLILAAQVAGGLAAASLGLLADAGHNLSDVVGIGLALLAVGYARRPPTAHRSYGYHRATILAALANAAAILAVTVYLAVESVRRLMNPEPVDGRVVLVIALVAAVANAVSARLLHEHAEHGPGDLNMRAALLHLAGDALASLGVAAAGLVILLVDGAYWLDPLVSLAIGALISFQAARLLRESVNVLLESTPRGLDLDALTRAMSAVAGVAEVHDLHVWSLSSDVRALSAHVVVEGSPTLGAAQVIGEAVKRSVAAPPYAIAHATLELECDACVEPGDPHALDRDLAPPRSGG